MADDWDSGADFNDAPTDKFNKFDPNQAIGGPPPTQDIIQGTSYGEETEAAPVPEPLPVVTPPKAKTGPPPRPTPNKSAGSSPAASSVTSPKSSPSSFPPPKREIPEPSSRPPLPPKLAADIISAPRTFSQRLKTGDLQKAANESFTTKLSPEALAYFTEVCSRPFSQQAVAFLNAYWPEVGSQAEFIFSCAYERIKAADMHVKGVNYIHLYDEGNDLDFNIALYFYEKLCKEVLEDGSGKKWRDDPKYAPSMPEMLTALVRKQELREKVDVNFDGRVSFLEYLLYQYRAYANPADFTFRSMAQGTEHEEIRKARLALEEVNKAIREYEREKNRLEEEKKLPGVKGLAATNLLAQLLASPLAEKLNMALIKAEAAVRIAGRKFGATGSVFTVSGDARIAKPTDGALWWMSRDLADKKARYGRS